MLYQALYRKYRPQKFQDLVGQHHITRTIQNAIKENKISHAYLFSGPRGTGKTSTAKIIAKTINCLNGPALEPCGHCSVCEGISSGEISDIIEIDAASNRGIDEIREVRDKVKYAPTVAKYKVYIIDEVHMLTEQAFNALLKTLEEPPKHVVFILATTEPHRIPVTIHSRCQRFDFKKITNQEIVKRLMQVVDSEGISIDSKAVHAIAKLSDGGMRDALSLLDQAISFAEGTVMVEDVNAISGTVSHEKIGELIHCVNRGDIRETLTLVDQLYAGGRDLVRLTEDFIFYLRDLLLYQVVPSLDEVENNVFVDDWFVGNAKNLDSAVIYEMITKFNEAFNEMKYTNHPKIFLELALIQLCKVQAGDVEKISAQKDEEVILVPELESVVEKKVEELVENDHQEATEVSEELAVETTVLSSADSNDLTSVDFMGETATAEETQEVFEPKVEEPVLFEETIEEPIEVIEPQESYVEYFTEEESMPEPERQEEMVSFEELPEGAVTTEETVEKYELDAPHYHQELKRVIINNVFATADKVKLNEVVMNWRELIRFVNDEHYGPVASLLADARVRVVSDGYLLVSYPHQAHVDRFYLQFGKVDDLLAQILDEEYYFAAITDVEWVRKKDEYITKRRRGEKFEMEQLPNQNDFYKRVVVPIEEMKEEAIVTQAFNMFGNDIVNVK